MVQDVARRRQAPAPLVASWTTLARGARPSGRFGQREGQAKRSPQPTRELTNHNRGRTVSRTAAGRRSPRAVCPNAPQGTTVGVTARPSGGIAAMVLGVIQDSHPRPVEHSVAQSDLGAALISVFAVEQAWGLTPEAR